MRSEAELSSALQSIDKDLAAGIAARPERIRSLREDALLLAQTSADVRFLCRLAKLLAICGECQESLELLVEATRIAPQDVRAAMLLSDALAAENKFNQALVALAPALQSENPGVGYLSRAARLNQRLGRFDRSVQLTKKMARLNPGSVASYLATLIAAGKKDDALAKARDLFAAEPDEPKICYACYSTFMKGGAGFAEIERARTRLLEQAEARGNGAYWRSRVLRCEGNLEAGRAVVESGLMANPRDSELLKEQAGLAVAEGHWGRDAAILLKARQFAAPFSDLANGIAQAESLLQACGGSLERAARQPEAFAHVASPETVFRRVVRNRPPPTSANNPTGIVMVMGSLAGGGAERILANTFRLLGEGGKFGRMKLYVADFAPETARDFYLPLTGLSRSDVVVLDQDCKVKPPLCWLGQGEARVSTCILQRLKEDRPAVVHAALEPLNVFAGLAALLAGVPRIVLHTHNMRPTQLAFKNASRLRECYRALLARPEVSLVGCAHACVRDYVEWLRLDDTSKIHVVHNGFDVNEMIAASGSESRTELRAAHGIDPDSAVIGTAFRFTQVKQPLLWVDAAAKVLLRHRNCRFVMFGDGELRRETLDYIGQRGLSEFFVLPGLVTDIYRRLPLLDLFVLSSRSEALPNVLLEAQAASVPVVAFDVGGVSETMISGVTGILVKHNSAEALADGILRALAAPEWLRTASAAGQKFVREQFNMEKMINALAGILLPDAHLPTAPGNLQELPSRWRSGEDIAAAAVDS